jgi:hypothetical protein
MLIKQQMHMVSLLLGVPAILLELLADGFLVVGIHP